jgi:hypothetical protein
MDRTQFDNLKKEKKKKLSLSYGLSRPDFLPPSPPELRSVDRMLGYVRVVY